MNTRGYASAARLSLAAVALLFTFSARDAFAATFVSNSGGVWSNASIWTPNGVPAPGDNVTVSSGHTVVADSSVTPANLTVNGTLDTSSFGVSVSGSLTLGGGSITGISGLTLGSNAGISGNGSIVPSLQISGGSNSTIASGTILSVTSEVQVDGTLTNNGALTVLDTSNGVKGSGTFNQGTSGFLSVRGPIGVAGFSATAIGNIVEYTNTSPQNVRGTTYYDLKFSNGGLKTATGPITVNRNLTVSGGTFSDGGNQITGSGTGTLQLGSGTTFQMNAPLFPAFGTYTYDPASTVNYGGNAAQTVAAAAAPYPNLILSIASGSSTKTASGSFTAATLDLNVTVGTVTFATAGNNITVTGAMTGSGALDQTSGGSFSVGGSVTWSGSFTPGTGKFLYAGTSQTIRSLTYYDLGLTGAGPYTAAGALTATHGLNTGSNSPALNLGLFTLQVGSGGTGDLAGTGSINGTATVTLSGSGNISGILTINNPVSISGTRTIQAGANITFTGAVSLATSTMVTNAATATLASLTGTDATSTWKNTGGMKVAGTLFAGPGTLDATTSGNSVEYNGTLLQTVYVTTYDNLYFTGSAAKTMTGVTAINSDFNITAGSSVTIGQALTIGRNVSINTTGVVALGAFTHSIGGSFSSIGTAPVFTGTTLDFNGNVNPQVITCLSCSFNNLSFSGTSSKTFGGSFNVLGNLTINSGATVNGGALGYAVDVAGNWANGGTFTPGNSTVTLSGATRTVSTSSFYNLTIGGSYTALGALTVLNDLTINPGATLGGGSGSHFVGHNFTQNSGYAASTSNVTFNTSTNSTLSGTFYDLTIAKGGFTATLAGSTTVNHNLAITSGTLQVSSFALIVTGSVTNDGSIDTGTGIVNIAGDVVNNGPFGGTSATVNLNGAAIQSWSGSANANPVNLTVSNASGLNLQKTVGVSGNLILSGGNITVTPGEELFVAGTTTRAGSAYVVGKLDLGFTGPSTKTFHVGTAAGYTPVDVTVTGGSGSLAIVDTDGFHPALTGFAAIARYWTLTNAGITQADLTFHFLNADNNGTETLYELGRYSGSWGRFAATSRDTTGHSITLTGVTGISADWTAAEPASLGLVALTSVHPATASISGGSTLYIEGTSLAGSTVKVGGVNASILSNTATRIVVRTPANVAGPASVDVTAPSAPVTCPNCVTYVNNWNISRDFSPTVNPNVDWTLGGEPSLNGTFTAFSSSGGLGFAEAWSNASAADAVHNPEASSITVSGWTLPVDGFGMHPGSAGSYAAVRWTSPANGVYHFAGSFKDMQASTSDVHIYHGATSLFTGSVTASSTLPFSFDRYLNSAQQIDFLVGDGGNGIAADSVQFDAIVTPTTGANLALTTTMPASTAGGSPYSYSIQVGNGGPDVASTVVMSHTVTGATITSISQSGWTCSFTATTVTCNVSTLANGGSGSVTVTATAPANGTLTYATSVASDNDQNLTNNTASDTTNVIGDADLALSASATPGTVASGANTDVAVVIANNGPSTANNATISFSMPPELTYLSVTGATCSGTTTISCNAGSIAAAGSKTVTLHFQAVTPGTPTLNVSVTADETDSIPGNNTASQTVTVTASSFVVTSPNDSGAGTLRAAITAANNAAVCPAPCGITFNLPAGQTALTLSAPLPVITANQLTIDATTQPGHTAGNPLVTMSGTACTCFSGFTLNGNSNTVRGFVIGGFVKGFTIAGSGNKVDASFIGITPANVAVPNGEGISISSFGSGNLVQGNVIASNTTRGVVIASGSTGNRIADNSTHDNGTIGIDLDADGVTADDAGDADTGANNLQNRPAFVDAILGSNGTLYTHLNLDSSAVTSTQSLRVELFAADTNGTEGLQQLGWQCFAANLLSNTAMNIVGAPIVAGAKVVATATSYADSTCTTVNDGTSEYSPSLTVAACTPPAATITPGGPTTFCTGGSVTLNAPAAMAGYLWSTGATTQSITVTSSGNYSVTVTSAAGCSSTSAATTVTVNAIPTATITPSGPTTFCAGGSVALSAPTIVGNTFLWSNGATSASITATATGSYSVTVTRNGCSSTSTPINVTVTPVTPATITAGGPTTFCNGGSVTLTANSGSSYLWSTGATSQAITVTAGGAYSVTVTYAGGCSAISANTVVSVTTPPALNVTASGPTTFCAGNNVTLTADPGFTTYLWSNGATGQSITVGAAASYTVTGTLGACNVTSSPTVVSVTPVPSAAISSPPGVNAGTGGYVASVPAGPAGTSYLWTISGGAISAGQGTPSITFSAANNAVTVILGANVTTGGCSNGSAIGIPVTGATPPPPPPPTTHADLGISVSGPASAGVSGNISYTITVTNAGPDSALNVTLGDFIDDGTMTSLTGSGWNCFTSPAGGTCTMANFAPGTSTLTALVTAPAAAGAIHTSASIASPTNDPNGTNNETAATTTIVNPAANCGGIPPSLIAPADGATNVSSPATFSWSAVTGASLYEVWIANAGSSPSLAGTSSSTSLTTTLPGGDIAWYVVARFAQGGCATLVSEQRRLNVTGGTNCAGHTTPALLAPSSGANLQSPVTFQWMPVPQAIGYRVWFRVDGGAAQDAGTTDGATQLSAPVPAGAIEWYVDALFNGCAATRSQTSRFGVAEIDECATHAAAIPTAPANGVTSTGSQLEFRWSAVSDAVGYRVWAVVNGGAPAILGITEGTSLKAGIFAGGVEWYVETLFDGCPSIDSVHRTLTVPRSQECGTEVSRLVSPAAGASTPDPMVHFVWTNVAEASGYELWLGLNGAARILLATTPGDVTSLTHEAAAGSLEWFVRATFDGCTPRDSEHAFFRVEPPATCSDQRPLLTAPLENAAGILSPVTFRWTVVPGATSYRVYAGVNGATPSLAGTTAAALLPNISLPAGPVDWYVEANLGGNCPAVRSSMHHFTVAAAAAGCNTPAEPSLIAPGQVSSNVRYAIQWERVPGASSYVLQESATADFVAPSSTPTTGDRVELQHANTSANLTTFFYRVRALASCNTTQSAYSEAVGVGILPASSGGSKSVAGALPLDGSQLVTYTIPLDASLAGQTFLATPNQPWITVMPAQGTVPNGGTTLTVIADTNGLPIGTSLGGVTLTFGASLSTNAVGGKPVTHAAAPSTTTVSMSKVAPISVTPKNTPPPDALIIPAVAHADGINSTFESDVRITNTAPQVMKYQLTFTPSGDEGIKSGKQTQIEIDPGRTIAIDDVLESWFSTGTTSATGVLEIRPLTQTATTTSSAARTGVPNIVTFASSRTFNTTAAGTFGQYIPAIPFANFIGKAADTSSALSSVLSLQQIAQSDAYRTNLGLVEGSGEPASLLVSVFGNAGQKLTEFPVDLKGGQHLQLNSFLAERNIQVDDGRVEVKVTSPGGKVTAYASVLDNRTNDPLLVTPVPMSAAGASKYVVAGVADLNNGIANWRTDMRVYNNSTSAVDATLSFVSQNGGEAKTVPLSLKPGEVKQLDSVLSSLFGITNEGGALHLATASASSLIATARTYNQTSNGTYGQFISAVTPDGAIGSGSRPLQLLQVEESDRFRSNIGIAEVSGQPATIELTALPPDSKIAATLRFDLAPNQFIQYNALLRSLNMENTYNARISVKVTGGTGRVTAYASVIDAATQDPTYIPAQ
jgi:hypothetical protein